MKTKQTKQIENAVSRIAGCSWSDEYVDRPGTLADRILDCANQPALGTDGDLTESDREKLRKLAALAV